MKFILNVYISKFDKSNKNYQINDIVSRLRTVSHSFYKLRTFLPVQTLQFISLYTKQFFNMVCWCDSLVQNALQSTIAIYNTKTSDKDLPK